MPRFTFAGPERTKEQADWLTGTTEHTQSEVFRDAVEVYHRLGRLAIAEVPLIYKGQPGQRDPGCHTRLSRGLYAKLDRGNGSADSIAEYIFALN